jgi:hypothetical protein
MAFSPKSEFSEAQRLENGKLFLDIHTYVDPETKPAFKKSRAFFIPDEQIFNDFCFLLGTTQKAAKVGLGRALAPTLD